MPLISLEKGTVQYMGSLVALFIYVPTVYPRMSLLLTFIVSSAQPLCLIYMCKVRLADFLTSSSKYCTLMTRGLM